MTMVMYIVSDRLDDCFAGSRASAQAQYRNLYRSGGDGEYRNELRYDSDW